MAAPTCPIAKGPSNPGDRIGARGGQMRFPPPVRSSPALLTRRSRPALLSREARVSPTAAPPRTDSGAWLAGYGELQNSLFLAMARPLGMSGAGRRAACGPLSQMAVPAPWMRKRAGEPIRNPRAFLRQVIINQRKMQLRSERRHPATSYDEIGATAGGSGIDGIADRRPSVSEQVERREVAEIVSHIL